MSYYRLVCATAVAFTLAGCLQGDSERALIGAAGGCLANEVILNGDCVDGALIGAVGGALLDDVTGR